MNAYRSTALGGVRRALALLTICMLVLVACSSPDDGDAAGEQGIGGAADAAEDTDSSDAAEETAAGPTATDTAGAPVATEPSAASAEPFRVLASTPVSGPLAALGTAISAGLNAARDIINEDGGILGQPVEITFVDNAGDPNQSVSVITEAIEGDVAFNMVWPGALGTTFLPALPVLADYPAPMCTSGSSPDVFDPEAYPTLFGSVPPPALVYDAIVAELVADGRTRVVAMGPDTTTGRLSAEVFETQAEGQLETTSVFLPADVVDATAALQQARDFDPDVVLMVSFFPAFATVVEARALLEWDVDLLGDWAASTVDFVSGASDPSILDNLEVTVNPFLVQGDPATETETFQRFHDASLSYDPDAVVGIIASVVSYDCLMLARAAAESAGSTDGPALVEAWAGLTSADDVPGWIGSERIYDAANGPYAQWAAYQASDFTYVRAGTRDGGLIVPLE